MPSKEETPEEEAKRLENEMKMAAATGDMATIISIVNKSASLTPADYIKKTVGNILFVYYTYIDKNHCHPLDLDDLIDGLLFLDAKSYITRQIMAEQEAKQKAQAKSRPRKR